MRDERGRSTSPRRAPGSDSGLPQMKAFLLLVSLLVLLVVVLLLWVLMLSKMVLLCYWWCLCCFGLVITCPVLVLQKYG